MKVRHKRTKVTYTLVPQMLNLLDCAGGWYYALSEDIEMDEPLSPPSDRWQDVTGECEVEDKSWLKHGKEEVSRIWADYRLVKTDGGFRVERKVHD